MITIVLWKRRSRGSDDHDARSQRYAVAPFQNRWYLLPPHRSCGCGRNTIRLSSILGRKGQMIKYKGTTLYPPALFDILDNIPSVKNYIIEVYTNELGTDEFWFVSEARTVAKPLPKRLKICSVRKSEWRQASILNRQSTLPRYKCLQWVEKR